MKRKIMLKSLLFVVCLVATVMLGSKNTVYAAKYVDDNDNTYEYSVMSDGTVRITDYEGKSSTINIPSKIDGKNVTVIGKSAFGHISSVSTVVIPDTVTSIESWAFNDSSLKCITIPSSVKSIGSNAFQDCERLQTVNLSDGLEKLGSGAFCKCKALNEIKIPSTITELNHWTFEGCESLTSITIPKNITMLGVGVFENCTSLKDITIEKHKNGLINGDIFDNTAWYNNQPDGVVYFENALYGYKGTMPENTSVTIKSGTTYIARSAFQGQKNLTGISFPKSLTYIGMCAFQSCTGVKEIIIPDTVTSIEQAAFRECTSLEKIKLPSNLTRISYDVFFMCSNLKEIEIPETVTAIYNYAFFQCTSLDSIYLSKNIEKIGPGAFAEMNGVKVIISEDNPYFMAENDIIYNKDKTELIVCLSTAEKVIIPDTVKTLSNGAFGSDNYLKEIVIPDSVTAIGNSVFAYCTSLQSISIPDTVTQFGGSMFCGCTAIKSIRLSENITSMGQLTFQGCENLVYVELPKSLYQIGDSAFMECLSLKSIKVPEGIKKIDIDAFCDCPALETVIIPDSVTVIGATILDGSNSEAVIYCSENSKARTYAINNSYLYDDIQNAPYVACVSGLNVSDITSSSAKLTWDKVDDAEGYVVYRYDSTTQAWTTVAETADLSYSVDGLCDGTEYLYSVNTYKTVNGNKVFGNIQMEVSFTTDQEEKAGEEASNNSGNTDGTGNTNESGNTDGTGNTSDSNETDEETDTEKTSLVKAKVI